MVEADIKAREDGIAHAKVKRKRGCWRRHPDPRSERPWIIYWCSL